MTTFWKVIVIAILVMQVFTIYGVVRTSTYVIQAKYDLDWGFDRLRDKVERSHDLTRMGIDCMKGIPSNNTKKHD